MNIRNGIGVLAASAACMGLLTAGCDQRNSADTVGQKVDRAADRIATATDQAATRTGPNAAHARRLDAPASLR